MNHIRDNLSISDAPTARTLSDAHPFDEVVTLGYLDSVGYTRPSKSTTADEFVFPDGPHDFSIFESAVNYIIESLERDKRVLVHCQAGVSRSGGVCAVVLAECEGLSISGALRDIQQARDRVNPAPEIRDSMERYTDETIDQPSTGYNNL